MRFVIVTAILLGPCTLDSQGDWPLFRGDPLQTGVVKGELAEPLETLWKIKVGSGTESTAAIVGQTIYLGSYDGHLYALDLDKGTEKWKYAAGSIVAPPSVHQGAVFVGDEDGTFHCVDARKGEKIWTFDAEQQITAGATFTGDWVLIGAHDSTLYCLEQKTGKEVWRFKAMGPVNGAAVVAGDVTFLAGCDSNLHIIDIKTGKGLAAIDLGGQAAATAAVVGKKVYVGTMANEFKAVDLAKKEVEWNYESKRGQPFFASAAVTDKLVVVGGRDRLVHALWRDKGTAAWTFPTKNKVDSSPIIIGNRVVVGSSDGSLYIIDLAKGTQVQKVELGRSILASPAYSNGRIIIGTTDGWVACLGRK